jgi:hypothetical protein
MGVSVAGVATVGLAGLASGVSSALCWAKTRGTGNKNEMARSAGKALFKAVA